MTKWLRQSNCFLSRFNVDPARRTEFIGVLDELCANAEQWYEDGCYFAFQGWARDPNQWVAIASWKSEEYLNKMRETPWFKDCQLRMLECCTGEMVMEQFHGMENDRKVFDTYPVGSSKVHMKTKSLDVVFV
jgi:quinol monooxygenase YgiN